MTPGIRTPDNVQSIDIVDSQFHIGAGGIDTTLAAMDALGIRSIMLDELWGMPGEEHPTHIQPGRRLDNGAWRTAFPTAQQAALLHPERFSYLVRIDPRDPQLESVMRTVASSPGARAFRIQPAWTLADVSAFAEGAYEPLFAIAQDVGLPVCAFIPGYVELLAPYLEKYPRLTLVIDHCGMGFTGIPAGRPDEEAQRCSQPAYLDDICKLGEYPNIAIKWSHAQSMFRAPHYPYEPLRPLLRKVLDAFGKERVLWASDNSVVPDHSWADLLLYLRDDPELSLDEKAWLLGGAARQVFQWPAAID